MIKDKLTIAAHITRKSEPWVVLATSALVIGNHLYSKKNS